MRDKIIFFITTIFFIFPIVSFGAYFPNDAITSVFTIPANSSTTILTATTTNTILSVYLKLNGTTPPTATGYVRCGNTGIASTGYGNITNTELRDFTYKCSENIVGYNTATLQGTSGYIVYVPYDLATIGIPTISTINGFTYGEIVISTFLFLSFCILLLVYGIGNLKRKYYK